MAQCRGKVRFTDFVGMFFVFGVLSLAGCASTDEQRAASADGTMTAMASDGEQSAVASAAPQSGGAFGDGSGVEATVVTTEVSLEDVPETVASPRVVESCKKEPYIKYEKASKASIKAGWQATKAEKYGVGFRHAAEYKKWSSTHNTLFKRVSLACETLSKCAKSAKKGKKKKCASQAATFQDLQALAKTFSDNVNEVKMSQVVKLCSMKPSLDDEARCFDALATNIRTMCKTDECGELAQCWQNIYFMDAALRQAESSCSFARQKLTQCRGYSEQIGRRKQQLKRCASMHEAVNLKTLPIL